MNYCGKVQHLLNFAQR